MSAPEDRLSKKLKLALSLQRLGIKMMRQNLRRRHPDASSREIDDRLRDWMRERPGDSDGVPSHRSL